MLADVSAEAQKLLLHGSLHSLVGTSEVCLLWLISDALSILSCDMLP